MHLREKLQLPAHMYRKVMMFSEDDKGSGGEFAYYVVAAYTDRAQTGAETSEIHILDNFANYDRSVGEMRRLVADVNDYIMASRRLVGLDTDEFAKQGID